VCDPLLGVPRWSDIDFNAGAQSERLTGAEAGEDCATTGKAAMSIPDDIDKYSTTWHAAGMHHVSVASNDVRIPDPEPGQAVLVTRYGADNVRAVIVHPEDFAWLEAIVDSYRARSRPLEVELTAEDLEAHAATDRDDEPWDELDDALDAEPAAV
jgi:hypothetical protein